MIKQIFAILKIIVVCIGGGVALLGLRYLTILVKTYTSPLHILLQILIWIALVVGGIAVFTRWYLRNEK